VLPDGDVLIHTGDIVANYGSKSKIVDHYADVIDWFSELAGRYRLIVFIGGNHDILLDKKKYPKYHSLPLPLHPKNCVNLEDSMVCFEGLKIYGTPVTPCRQEMFGKRYYSAAFERTRAERSSLYSLIPDGVDILLTHVPPQGILDDHSFGDDLLRARLQQMSAPPRFHCFGHIHQSHGVCSVDGSVCLNAAQEPILRTLAGVGGLPLVFDVPLSVK
jgi:Icc-related predicted phosphoesterase